MASKSPFKTIDLLEFNRKYDVTHENIAQYVRGEFLRTFPKKQLGNMRLRDYVIGRQRPTFCNCLESKTKAWANIHGSTAYKFGIYYGKTKSDPRQMYRFTRKHGTSEAQAFRSVREAIVEVLELGEQLNLDFEAIDDNPLSQMVKAKILSLYLPERFVNICSAEHLEMIGIELGLPEDWPASQYQHYLMRIKDSHPMVRKWSNPKFMAYLYARYVPGHAKANVAFKAAGIVHPPTKKVPRKVNFEDIQDQRGAIGKAAEEYALQWEKERLRGGNLAHLVSKIDDRRERPGYGYDFLSHTTSTQHRCIEVKSVGKAPGGGGYRFFLSENEHSQSLLPNQLQNYYFYLVFFNGDGKPDDLQPVLASELYRTAKMLPASYTVRFTIER